MVLEMVDCHRGGCNQSLYTRQDLRSTLDVPYVRSNWWACMTAPRFLLAGNSLTAPRFLLAGNSLPHNFNIVPTERLSLR